MAAVVVRSFSPSWAQDSVALMPKRRCRGPQTATTGSKHSSDCHPKIAPSNKVRWRKRGSRLLDRTTRHTQYLARPAPSAATVTSTACCVDCSACVHDPEAIPCRSRRRQWRCQILTVRASKRTRLLADGVCSQSYSTIVRPCITLKVEEFLESSRTSSSSSRIPASTSTRIPHPRRP